MKASRNFPSRTLREMLPVEQRREAATYAEHEADCPFCGWDGRRPLADCDWGATFLALEDSGSD